MLKRVQHDKYQDGVEIFAEFDMTREQALKFLKENLHNANLIKHSLAVEAVMRTLADHFNEDQEKWGLVGLLHDIDYEKVKDDLSQHSLVGAKMLQEAGLTPDICQAVKVHNEAHAEKPKTLMEKALFVIDPLTGLIVAATLVLPSRKLADLKPESIMKRFHEPSFARGANRQIISQCQQYLSLSLEEFFALSLKAMQQIASDLGLNYPADGAAGISQAHPLDCHSERRFRLAEPK